MDLQEVGWGVSTGLMSQVRDRLRALVNAVMDLWVKNRIGGSVSQPTISFWVL
jgi:hypothetical protein